MSEITLSKSAQDDYQLSAERKDAPTTQEMLTESFKSYFRLIKQTVYFVARKGRHESEITCRVIYIHGGWL